MNPAKRIIVNTGVQYTKAIITMGLTLYTTRLVLDALSVGDYGIYMVIAGVVAMLGFITNALAVTTLRYLSYHQVHTSADVLRKIFVNSLFIHLMFGVITLSVILAIKGLLFSYVLNIDAQRVSTAEIIYVISAFMLLTTILTSPYKALLIAHENIVYIAIIEVIDSVIKLGFAVGLSYITFDRLLIYQCMVGSVVFLNLLAFSIYALIRFPESAVFIRYRDIEAEYIRKITGFAGWTTYGMGCVAGRLQGTALVLNHFWGTAINAAYGISCQIFAAISFLVGSILNAMNPQLMQAEGSGDRQKMLTMAMRQSKFATAILAIVVVPLIAEMPAVLAVWLKEVPDNTVMFCRIILMSFLIDQITVGLGSANQAMGNIRIFSLLTYTPKLLFLPAIWIMFVLGYSLFQAMMLYFFLELSVALVRIPYMHHKAGLGVGDYFRKVLLPIFFHILAIASACWLCVYALDFSLRFVATALCSLSVGLLSGYLLVMDTNEQVFVKKAITQKMKL